MPSNSLVRPHVGSTERIALEALKTDKYGRWTEVFTEDQLIRMIERVLQAVDFEEDDEQIAQIAHLEAEIEALHNELFFARNAQEDAEHALERWRP